MSQIHEEREELELEHRLGVGLALLMIEIGSTNNLSTE